MLNVWPAAVTPGPQRGGSPSGRRLTAFHTVCRRVLLTRAARRKPEQPMSTKRYYPPPSVHNPYQPGTVGARLWAEGWHIAAESSDDWRELEHYLYDLSYDLSPEYRGREHRFEAMLAGALEARWTLGNYRGMFLVNGEIQQTRHKGDFRGALLKYVDLGGVDFTGARLDGAVIHTNQINFFTPDQLVGMTIEDFE